MKHNALGAYIFAGGFTIGVHRYFNVIGHLEGDRYGVASAKLNFPKLPIHVGVENWPLHELRRKKIRFIYGNPPCAAWSALNGKKTVAEQSWKSDPRVDCARQHFSLIESLRPDVWVWESVDRAYTAGREFVDDLTERAYDMGYAVTHLLVDAQYLGTPHRRRRFFLVVHRYKIEWRTPRFTESKPARWYLQRSFKPLPIDHPVMKLPQHHLQAYRATHPGDAIQGAWDKLNPKSRRKIRTSTTGKKYFVGRPAFKNIRLDPDNVCPTVVGLNLIHPTQPRHLSVSEMRTLCGYPSTFKIEDARTGQFDLLTRAVMPPVGAWLARHVSEALDQRRRVTTKIYRVDFRTAPGKIEVL